MLAYEVCFVLFFPITGAKNVFCSTGHLGPVSNK